MIKIKTNCRNIELDISELDDKYIKQLETIFTKRNPQYDNHIKKSLPVTGLPQYYKMYELKNNIFSFPRGSYDIVEKFLKNCGKECDHKINKPEIQRVDYNCDITLRDEQIPIVEALKSLDMGLYCAPCGSGKTVTGLALVNEIGCSTMILVHTVDLLKQWVGEIGKFFKLPEKDIGIIGNKKFSVKTITVALMQTVISRLDDLKDEFDLIFVDEAHHTPCDTVWIILSQMNAWYRFGTTATPLRRDNKEFILFALLGDIQYALENSANTIDASVYVVKTGFYFPHYSQDEVPRDEKVYFCKQYGKEMMCMDPDCTRSATNLCEVEGYNGGLYKCRQKFVFEKNHTHLINITSSNKKRNVIIFKYLHHMWRNDCHILALFDRKSSIALFSNWLDLYKIPYGVLVSAQKNATKDKILKDFKNEDTRVILGTKVADEGLDLPILDTVFLCNPCVNNKGLLAQRIGRCERIYTGKTKCRAVYFWDARQFPWHLKRLEDLYEAKLVDNVGDIC